MTKSTMSLSNNSKAANATTHMDSVSMEDYGIDEKMANTNALTYNQEQDDEELKVVICARLHASDVVFSHQGATDHPSNELFEQVLQNHVQDYKNASSSGEKQQIAQTVVDVILARNPKVRFVACHSPNGPLVKLSIKDVVQLVVEELERQVASVHRRSARKRKSDSQCQHDEKQDHWTKTRGSSGNNKDRQAMETDNQDANGSFSTHDLHENDVLCTKTADKKADALPGNAKFLELLPQYQQAYLNAFTDDDRLEVAKTFIQEFQTRNPPGRFVKRLDSGTLAEIRSSSVVQKVMRALARQAGKNGSTIMKTNPTMQSGGPRKRTRATRTRENQVAASLQQELESTIKTRSNAASNKVKAKVLVESQEPNKEPVKQGPKEPLPIDTLHEHDVLCTPYPDKVADALPGNTLFRNMVCEYREAYQAATCEDGRVEVATRMIATFQSRHAPGRFVKRCKDGSFVEIQQRSILQKVSRALARGQDPLKTNSLLQSKSLEQQQQEEDTLPTRRKRRCVTRIQDEHEAAASQTRVDQQADEPKGKRTARGAASKGVSSTPEQSSKQTITTKATPARKPSRTVAKQVTPASAVSKKRVKVSRAVAKQVTPASTASKKKRTSSPRTTLANRVSPETVPRRRSSRRTASRSATPVRGVTPIPMTEEEAVDTPEATNSKPHGLGLLAQQFTEYVLQSDDPEEIDLEAAVKHMKIPRRRIYDVINILIGAGVLEQNKFGGSDINKNTFRWAAPLICSEKELEQKMQAEEEQLDVWIERLESLCKQNKRGSISGRHLAPLMDEDTTMLAVHLPPDSIIRTVDMPMEEEEMYAFKLTMPASKRRKDVPKASLLTNGKPKLLPVDLSPPPSKAEPILVPPYYPYEDSPHPRSVEHQQGLNPLDMLLQVLPKPPPKVNGQYGYYSNDDEPSLRLERPLGVSEDEDRERPQTPFEALLHASTICE